MHRHGYILSREMPSLVEAAKLRLAFAQADADGSGSIQAEELSNVLESLGYKIELSQCMDILTQIDSDSDGTVSFFEFLSFFRNVPMEVRLKAEAEAANARVGTTVLLDLTKKMGMIMNPDGQVTSVTSGGQVRLQSNFFQKYC